MTLDRTTHRPDAIKEDSMIMQKKMIANHFERLSNTDKTGEKAVYTFVPGNLNELIWSFDLLPVHPEINALQSAMRKQSGDYVLEAEKIGHSEDVCTYVKSDIGMMRKGNIGPTGQRLPEPSLLLLSYTGCFTFMKWFELLKQEYKCPVVMLHVPYQADGRITPEMRFYVTKQLKDVVIPKLEEISGVDAAKFTEKLFTSGSVLTSLPAEEAIVADCKEFQEQSLVFSVAQIEELGFDQFWKRKDEVMSALERYRAKKSYYFAALLVTDVVSNSSLLLVTGAKAFLKHIDYPMVEERVFELTGVVSRKKQLLPYISHCLKKGGNRAGEAA